MAEKSDERGERAFHFSSPKVHALLELLEEQYNKCNPDLKEKRMQVLVFVDEKMTAKILSCVLTVRFIFLLHYPIITLSLSFSFNLC